MCIGAWTLDHPDYALILCTNRDEFLNRSTQDAHFHSFQDDDYHHHSPSSASGNVLSGRDEKAGGSWFGLSRAGRVALLTNITEPAQSFASSRGYLVSSFLLSDSSNPLEDEVGKIIPQDAEFAGFNLLLLAPGPPGPLSSSPSSPNVDVAEEPGRPPSPGRHEARVSSCKQKLAYDAILVTNHGAKGRLEARRLSAAERACGCISNGIDGQGGNEWPKVKQASHDFNEVLGSLSTNDSLRSRERELIERLFHILTWRSPEQITRRAQLRNTVQVTPVPIVLDPSGASAPSPPTLDSPSKSAITVTPATAAATTRGPQPLADTAPGNENFYATRLSTVLLIRRDGSVLFIERDIWRLGKDGKPERLDYKESQGEGEAKERIFEFNLDLD